MNNSQPTGTQQILVFTLDEPRYALRLSAVERVVRSVEVTPLPKAPQFVLGVVNVHGEITPVIDIRPCFGLPQHEINPGDHFILARTTSGRRVVLVADCVDGIRQLAEREQVTAEQSLPGIKYIHGLAKLEGNLILICDLDQFLDFEDALKLEAALAEMAARPADKTRRKAKQAA